MFNLHSRYAQIRTLIQNDNELTIGDDNWSLISTPWEGSILADITDSIKEMLDNSTDEEISDDNQNEPDDIDKDTKVNPEKVIQRLNKESKFDINACTHLQNGDDPLVYVEGKY